MAAEESAHASPAAALTQSMAAGDDAAFNAFHAAYAPRLFRYALVLMRGDEHHAAEVLQDTLIRVARHVRRFDDESILWDWLARLTRSAAADHGRKRGRYRRILDFFFEAQPAGIEPPEDDQFQGALDAALEQMPADDAALLRAKYHAQTSQRELARQHGISEDAIESRLRRAREALRQRAFQILRQHEP